MTSEQDLESMAVVGHVADIVHAFKEGAGYLRRIRERRKTRPPPRGLVTDIKSMQDLEFSLTRGQDVVRSHYERDYRRLGQPYATGDHEAAILLKTILSELQRIVVANLRSAYQHDQHVDFLMLQDLSDESQDRAIMCLMQLHQRILTSSDLDTIVAGNPYGGAKTRSQPRPKNAPRVIMEEQTTPPPQRRDFDSVSPQEYEDPSRHASGPLTPDLSPLQEPASFIAPQNSQHNPFRRPKPTMLPLNDAQPTVPTLPTPPAEKILSAPPGPPPTAPLPPAPLDPQRHRRREELASLRSEAERRAVSHRPEKEPGRSFLNRTFEQPQNTWSDPWDKRSWSPRDEQEQEQEQGFQEPHPGIPVDPSQVDEPRLEFGDSGPRSTPPVYISLFPAPSTSPRRQGLIPPNRLSTMSTATYSSHASASSAVSATSRSSNATSTGSISEAPSGPHAPSMSFASRSKSMARVPEPIYETSTLAGSMSTLRQADVRRPSAPDFVHSPTSPPTQTVPPIPPIPIEQPRPNLDTRRASAFSQRSNSSSNSGMTASALPVRTIPAQITDASNSKLYMPTEGNKFGGLCKGAWRAQIGDFKKAYQAQQRPGGVASTRMVDFMKCKNCDFSGKVALNEKGKKGPDRKVIIDKATSLAYRWDFLFKSHSTMKGGSSADAEYGCMFCCAEGKGTPVFKGMTAFIAHTAEHRPGAAGNGNDCRVPDAAVCDRMEAAVGRSLAIDERSEIGLPPADGQAQFALPEGPLSPMSNLSIGSPDGRAGSRGSSRY